MRIAYASLIALVLAGCQKGPVPAASTTNLVVTATLSTNSIHVGDVTTLRVNITHPAEGRLEFPDLAHEKEILVRDVKEVGAGTAYSLTSLVTGNHIVSTNSVRFVKADGEILEQPFPFLTLQVESLLKGTNITFNGMKDLVDWPNKTKQRLLIVFGAAALLALAAGLVALALNRRKRPALPPPPAPPPHQLARAALQALRQKQYIEKELVEPFYVELSTIVRTYIESRFHLRAPELTTEEFIREATNSRRLSMEHQQLALAFLEQCDLVKFAKHRPQADDMRAAFVAAERLVEETIPT